MSSDDNARPLRACSCSWRARVRRRVGQGAHAARLRTVALVVRDLLNLYLARARYIWAGLQAGPRDQGARRIRSGNVVLKRYVAPLIVGLLGVGLFCTLAIEQVQRAQSTARHIDHIARLLALPADDLPAKEAIGPELNYTGVQIVGGTTGQELLVLGGAQDGEAVYHVVSAFETGDKRRVLVDRGIVPDGARHDPRPPTAMIVTGNLRWPQEADAYTAAPDMVANMWFARDVPEMAAALRTEPVLVVARAIRGDVQDVALRPVAVTGIPNKHMSYAIAWIFMAIAWAGMTAGVLWRIRP